MFVIICALNFRLCKRLQTCRILFHVNFHPGTFSVPTVSIIWIFSLLKDFNISHFWWYTLHYREKEVCNYQGSTTALVINNHELDDNQFPSSWWRSLNINYPDTGGIWGNVGTPRYVATSSSGIITVISTGKINRNNTKIIVVSPYDDF